MFLFFKATLNKEIQCNTIHVLFFIKKVRLHFFNNSNNSFLIFILSEAKACSLFDSRNSLGYSRTTSKTQTFELLLLYLFQSKYLGSIHFNPPDGRNLDI